MNKNPMRYVLALISALSLGAVSSWAQVAASPEATPGPRQVKQDNLPDQAAVTVTNGSATRQEEQVVVLDPFTVTTEQEGYKSDDTLAGGRVRTLLRDTPASLSVITKKLLDDLAIYKAEDLLIYTNDTEVAGLGGNFSGVSTRGQGISISGAAEGTRLTNPAGVNRSRGLTAMDSTRNYFLSDIPWDGFNISRVDISRGPNSFLFGVGSPSGISNVSTNEAVFKDKGSVEMHYGSFGSTRESLDINKVLLPNELAFRLDAVNDDARYQQDPAYNHSKRIYGAVRFDPALFGESNHTKIQANFENGRRDSNNPRTLPPLDYITGYLHDPNASKTGYNPWTYTMDTSISSDPAASSWSGSGSLGNQYAWGNGAPQFYYDATTGKLLSAGQASFTTPTSNGYSATSNTDNVHTVGYGSYAITENYKYLNAHNQVDGGPFVGAFKGTVSYLDKTLDDPSTFDFYHKLIDGDNKHEWQGWNAFNVSVVQSLFKDRLVMQAVADHEQYTSGQTGLLNSRTPVLVLDLNSYLLRTPTWLDGAQANPNVGRPLVFGDQGNKNVDEYIRNNYQLTAAYNLDFERDFGLKGTLAKLLGHQDFTALGGRYDRLEEHRSYKLNGVDPNYQIVSGSNAAPHPTDIGFNWAAYTGSDLLGTSGAGANLSNLAYSLTPPSAYPYTVFSKAWTAGSSVNPTDPWMYTGPGGSAVTATQADNPANYTGYTGVTLPAIYGSSNADVLMTGGNKKRQTITSEALMYQGHFWDDTIIPTFGFRRDKTLQRGNDATQFQDQTTQIYNPDYQIIDPGVEATTTSKSWGVTLHLPKAIKKKLPEGTDVSLYYFHGANETPKVRYAIDGTQLPNESGKTDDFSVQVDALKGRATVRFTYFKTVDNNAQASYGQPLGNLGWKIDSIPSWTLGFAAFALAYRDQPNQLPADWPTWANGWMTDWISQHGAVGDNIANLLKTDFVKMFPQSYWDSYGYTVSVAAIQRGDWVHVANGGTDYPSPWSFGGSHQIHGEWGIIDQNLESKGYELEATFRPLKNWDITFNGSKVDATQTSLGAAAANYLNGMAKLFLATDLGKVAEWGGYSDYGATKSDFMSSLWAPYLQQVALTGSPQPELRKYHFNVISNYKVDRGSFKGLNLGGAYRWQDKAILGYGTHQALVYGEQGVILDVNKPIYGPTDAHFDAWIGYERKLSNKIDWRIQLNLRNVGEKVHLVTVAVEPDGSVAQSRIMNGQTYELSTKFSF